MTEKTRFQNELTGKIAGFLNEIGIRTVPAKLAGETFLPGIRVEKGRLLVDEEKLVYPGDLLHEAGHLAVAPARFREQLSDEVALPGFNLDELETQAIVWSYAACVHLEIDPRVVFHAGGYKGKAESLLFSFSLGMFVGLHGLEANGMTFSSDNALAVGAEPFPAMRKWLCD